MDNNSSINRKIAAAYESVVNEKFKDDVVGNSPHVQTMAIMTLDNPLKQKLTSADNRLRAKRLEAVLKNSRIPYRKVLGKYEITEHSYQLINVSTDDVKRLCAMFNQQSFVFAKKNADRNDADRGLGMTYSFYAYKNSEYLKAVDQFESTGQIKLKEEERTYPKFNEKLYLEVDTKDSIEYHPTDKADDDYYTRKNGYKFSVPFTRFSDEDLTEAEKVVEAFAAAKGDERFSALTKEIVGENYNSKWRWQNRVMLYGRNSQT